MNIYIYGSEAFKKQTESLLTHSNLLLKMEDGKISLIDELETLKSLIKDNGGEIFLIDQDKVIEDDFVSKYLKFLVPRDGITRHFLDQYGLGDVSLRESSDLVMYIDKRIEAIQKSRPKACDIKSIDEMFDLFDDDSSKE